MFCCFADIALAGRSAIQFERKLLITPLGMSPVYQSVLML